MGVDLCRAWSDNQWIVLLVGLY